jgi:primosomal protein N' (replication factor Y)
VRTLLRVPLADAVRLSTALRAAAGVRSARRASGVVRVRVDPVDLA